MNNRIPFWFNGSKTFYESNSISELPRRVHDTAYD